MNNEKQELLEQASKAYYEGEPIMSDEAFDTLSDLVKNPKVGYTVDGSGLLPCVEEFTQQNKSNTTNLISFL